MHTRLCAAILRRATPLLKAKGKWGALTSEIVDAALPDAMTILDPGKRPRAWLILEDLVEEALEGPEHAPLPVMVPWAEPDELLALAEAEETQIPARQAKIDLLNHVLAEAERRGLKPGRPVMGVFARGEAELLFSGLPRIMQREAPRGLEWNDIYVWRDALDRAAWLFNVQRLTQAMLHLR
jgi:hypothetical protein